MTGYVWLSLGRGQTCSRVAKGPRQKIKTVHFVPRTRPDRTHRLPRLPLGKLLKSSLLPVPLCFSSFTSFSCFSLFPLISFPYCSHLIYVFSLSPSLSSSFVLFLFYFSFTLILSLLSLLTFHSSFPPPAHPSLIFLYTLILFPTSLLPPCLPPLPPFPVSLPPPSPASPSTPFPASLSLYVVNKSLCTRLPLPRDRPYGFNALDWLTVHAANQ